MGKEIVYCGACGTILMEKDFVRGLAHTVERCPFCTRCRPLSSPTFPVRGTRNPEPGAATRRRRRKTA